MCQVAIKLFVFSNAGKNFLSVRMYVNVLTWNLREGDAETADLADVHGRLQQRLDGVQLRVRRVVVLRRYYKYFEY